MNSVDVCSVAGPSTGGKGWLRLTSVMVEDKGECEMSMAFGCGYNSCCKLNNRSLSQCRLLYCAISGSPHNLSSIP